MMRRKIACCLAVAALLAPGLSGCGKKGPLYLPGDPAAAASPEAAPLPPAPVENTPGGT